MPRCLASSLEPRCWAFVPNSEKLPPPDLPELYSRWRLDLPEREIGTNGIVGPFQDDKLAAPASTIKEVADNGWINDEWVVDMFCNALPGRPGYSMGSSPGLDVL